MPGKPGSQPQAVAPALPSFYIRLKIAIVGGEDLAGIDQRQLTEPSSPGIVVAQRSEFGANAVARLERSSAPSTGPLQVRGWSFRSATPLVARLP